MCSSVRPAFGEPVDRTARAAPQRVTFRAVNAYGDVQSSIDPHREAGYAAGYMAGWGVGYHAATAEIDAQRKELLRIDAQERVRAQHEAAVAVQVLAQAAAAMRERALPVVKEVSNALVMKSIELAEAIIGKELSDTRKSAQIALERAMADPDLREEIVRIKVSQQDYDTIQHFAAELPGAQLPEGVKLVPADSLAPGDAICDLPEGYIDARISAAFTRVKELVLGTADTDICAVSTPSGEE